MIAFEFFLAGLAVFLVVLFWFGLRVRLAIDGDSIFINFSILGSLMVARLRVFAYKGEFYFKLNRGEYGIFNFDKEKLKDVPRLPRFKIPKCDITVNLGNMDDAFLTSMAVVSSKVFINVIIDWTKQFADFKKIDISVVPNFTETRLKTSANISIKISIFQIISFVLRKLYLTLKGLKGKLRRKKYAK